MLTELRVENFAIIDRLDLQLGPHLITFTGETGAGKSIVIDAVEAILGGRAESTAIRSGAERCNLEAVFRIPESNRSAILAILEREELLDDLEYLVLSRELRSSGRNSARVNGRPASTALLRELGELLVDVHGQSEHLSLLHVNQHQGLLDRYAISIHIAEELSLPALEGLLQDYRLAYQHWQETRAELERLRNAEKDAARRLDMLNYQIREIELARLLPAEEAQLRDERNRLANAEGLAKLCQEALLALDEGTPETQPASDLLGQTVNALSGLSRLDASQSGLYDQSQELLDGLSELARQIRAYLDGIEFNPKRLDQVEERLALIQNLKHKYGDSIEAILAYASKAQQELEEITSLDDRLQELEEQLAGSRQQIARLGTSLARIRHAAAERLSQEIISELADLQMSGANFRVEFHRRPDPEGVPLGDGENVAFDASGLERVEFYIAPNPGEGYKPLAKIASGGETSRLMLALKNVLAQADRIPSLIFDEIDQGIGGRVGAIVGQKLYQLATQHQVICITHLPQLAAYGEQHFQVKKNVIAGRTTTQVIPLEGEARLVELAQMLGSVSENNLRSAQEMIDAVETKI